MTTKRHHFLISGTYDAHEALTADDLLSSLRTKLMLWTEPVSLTCYRMPGMVHPQHVALRDVWMEMSEDERAGLPGRLRDALAIAFVEQDKSSMDDPAPSTH